MSSGNESLERERGSVVRLRGYAELGWGRGTCSEGEQCLASRCVTQGNVLPGVDLGFTPTTWAWKEAVMKCSENTFPKYPTQNTCTFYNSNSFLNNILKEKMWTPCHAHLHSRL